MYNCKQAMLENDNWLSYISNRDSVIKKMNDHRSTNVNIRCAKLLYKIKINLKLATINKLGLETLLAISWEQKSTAKEITAAFICGLYRIENAVVLQLLVRILGIILVLVHACETLIS